MYNIFDFMKEDPWTFIFLFSLLALPLFVWAFLKDESNLRCKACHKAKPETKTDRITLENGEGIGIAEWTVCPHCRHKILIRNYVEKPWMPDGPGLKANRQNE